MLPFVLLVLQTTNIIIIIIVIKCVRFRCHYWALLH